MKCSTLAVLAGVGVGLYVGYTLMKDFTEPEVQLAEECTVVKPGHVFGVTASDTSGIRSLKVLAYKDDVSYVLVNELYREPLQSISTQFKLPSHMHEEGGTKLEVLAQDASLANFGSGNVKKYETVITVDSRPPVIRMQNTKPGYIMQGGTGAVHFSVDEDAKDVHVICADRTYKAYRVSGNDYVSMVAFPADMPPANFSLKAVAVDMAGNTSEKKIPFYYKSRKFTQDTIRITDTFLQQSAERMKNLDPAGQGSLLERYLRINQQMREANRATLRVAAGESSDKKLWNGAFLRLPRAASRAGFGDIRLYEYNKQLVDTQRHLGCDFASSPRAKIPAANDGRVIFADALGIYGNVVILDHGLSVMSLYAHLSEFSVKKGAVVRKGDILGRTGSSGMVFGDHLHFAMLVNGEMVSPVEWLDKKWLNEAVEQRIAGAAG